MLYSDNGVTQGYNAKDNTKSNWSTAYFNLKLVYMHMVPRNSIQLLDINTTKFQVERETV